MNKQKTIKQITATLIMPVVIYLVMLIVSASNGKTYNIFDSDNMLNIMKKTSYMTIIALGIGFQLGYGRFDFSGGAITVIAAMVAARVCQATGLGIPMLMFISIITAMVTSTLHGLIYVKFRVPISVISLATAFLLEAFSGLIIKDTVNLQITSMNKLYNSALVLVPLLLAVVVCFIFQKFTTAGRQATLLSRNQAAAVNIGINEKKNTIICYLVSGFIFGCAGSVYAVSNYLNAITVPLSTAGTLFGNIIPSLVGLFLMRWIDGTLGTFIGALTIQTLYYGLDVNGISGGVKTICYAVFLAIFIFISGFWDVMILYIKNTFRKVINKIKKTKPKLEKQ